MSTFDDFSAQYLPVIESALSRPFQFNYTDSRDVLRQAILYSVSAKAKRIRPLLCIASYRLFESQYEKILPLVCAVEWIHTYSLIHDDLPSIDNDDFRRGIPTCHKQFGEAMAILAGDSLCAFAFEHLAEQLPVFFPAELSLKAISLFGRACGMGGMTGGQVMDIQSLPYSTEDMTMIHRLKTGALIHACLVIPGLLLNIPEPIYSLLSRIGFHFGLIFQIIDDVLDVTQSSEILGKTANKDLLQDKWTAVKAYGLDGAIALARSEAQQARKLLDQLEFEGYASNDLVSILDYLLQRTF